MKTDLMSFLWGFLLPWYIKGSWFSAEVLAPSSSGPAIHRLKY